VGTSAAPALGDLDADGDLDVVSGTYLGHFAFFENTGTAVAPLFAERTGTNNPLDGEQFVSDSAPALADLDGDGDLDLVAGRALGGFALFENTGSATSPAFEKAAVSANPFAGLDAGDFSVPALADLDGDGSLDLVSGSQSGDLSTFLGQEAPVARPPPAVPAMAWWGRALLALGMLGGAWRRRSGGLLRRGDP
jgi:hypothetical protein